MKYEINPKKICKLVALPFEIIEYINKVSGENLKVLLAIFSEKSQLSVFELSTRLELNVWQIEEAIKFWQSKGILKLEKTEKIQKSGLNKPSALQISAEELKTANEKDNYVEMLFKEAERLYSRPLKPIERRTLLYIYEFYNMQIDIILMVIDFCIRSGKPLKSIISICENFSENEVTTHEQAERQIQLLSEKFSLENQIRNCFGIYDRKLSTNEKNLIQKWTTIYGFKINMIKLAFDKCVDSTGKLSFPYIEKILLNWKKNNIKLPKDIEKTSNSKIFNGTASKNKTSYNLYDLITKNNLILKK